MFWSNVDPFSDAVNFLSTLSSLTCVHLILIPFLTCQFIREGFISCWKGLFVLSPVGQVYRIWNISKAADSACHHFYQHAEISNKEVAHILWKVYPFMISPQFNICSFGTWYCNWAVLTIVITYQYEGFCCCTCYALSFTVLSTSEW